MLHYTTASQDAKMAGLSFLMRLNTISRYQQINLSIKTNKSDRQTHTVHTHLFARFATFVCFKLKAD